jgi:hypothetical protein
MTYGKRDAEAAGRYETGLLGLKVCYGPEN